MTTPPDNLNTVVQLLNLARTYMERGAFKNYIEDTLSHLNDEITLMLNPLSPKTQPMPEIIESLADVLSDPESFDFKVEEMRAFVIYLETSKESGTPMAKAPYDTSQILASVTLDVTSTHSAGVGVTDAGNHISLRSTGPHIARWNLLNAQSVYHPLVVRSNFSQGAIQTFAKQIYGGSLDHCKSSFDMYARIDTCLLHIWCHIFDHWLGVKIVEPLYSPDITNSEKSSIKTDSKDDIKMSNEEYIKTEFPEIMIQSGPKRHFSGVNIARPKRKRGASNDSKDSKANLSKKVKQEIKKEEDIEIMIYEVKNSNICIHFPSTESDIRPDIPRFQIPPYPASWPDCILQRLAVLDPLNPLPALSEDFMSHTFSRKEFSTKFGSSMQQYDSRWIRTKKALKLMPGLDNTFLVGANSNYNFPPHVRCAPGILMNDPGHEMPNGEEEPRTVFVRVRPGAWLYVGEYQLKLSDELELTEWNELPEKMKQDHTTELDRDEFDSGEKKLWVYTMQCIGYHKESRKQYARWILARHDSIARTEVVYQQVFDLYDVIVYVNYKRKSGKLAGSTCLVNLE